VKFNVEGTRLLVTNEGEPNALYTIDPEGTISVIDTSGFLAEMPVAPAQIDVQSINFSAWISLQENNAFAVLDLSGTTPVIKKIAFLAHS
jgi:hypothetical protein